MSQPPNRPSVFGHSIGTLCLCIYLILIGILTLFSLKFSGEDTALGILAILAGVLMLLGW